MPGKGIDTKTNRPRKQGAARKRREKEHRVRLAALGISAEKIANMDAKAVRTMLHKLSAREQKSA